MSDLPATELERTGIRATHHDKVLIIDFGSQVTQLIARRVREAGVYCEIVPFTKAAEAFDAQRPKAVILSGGPASVPTPGSPRAPQAVFDAGIPVLGICYGQMLMAEQLGGAVRTDGHGEFGRAEVAITGPSRLFEGLWDEGSHHPVWMSHGDAIARMPEGFAVVGASDNAPYAIIADEARSYFGLMFHPEVVHTPDGARLIANFLHKVVGLKSDWTMAAFRDEAIAAIRAQVGEARVICGLSGGVDSVGRGGADSRGDRRAAHLRLRRPRPVAQGRGTRGGGVVPRPLQHPAGPCGCERDVSPRARGGERSGGQAKDDRRLVHRRLRSGSQESGRRRFLAQGTLYPDVIESVSPTGGPSVTIKSHHNVGGLPARMNMALVEPLRALFKDEVRLLGATLGLPPAFVGRHPFPGPGLAIRVPGAVSREALDVLRQADAIYLEEIRKAGLYDTIWQAFAVLLPVRTVGVMGDGRTYDQVCALRAVTSTDGMTADFFPFDMAFLGRTATRIINEVKGINRVVYDVTSKPPGTIEWE